MASARTGSALQGAKHRHGMVDAIGLNAHHLLAEVEAKLGGVARRGEACPALTVAACLLDFQKQRGVTHDLIGKILAVFEEIDDATRHLGVLESSRASQTGFATAFSRNDSKPS